MYDIVAASRNNTAHFPGNQGLTFSFAERGDVVAELAAAKQEIMELRAQLLAVTSVASALNGMRTMRHVAQRAHR